MTDERLRAFERRWKETGAGDDLTRYVTELGRADKTLEEALEVTQGRMLRVIREQPELAPHYACRKDALINEWIQKADDERRTRLSDPAWFGRPGDTLSGIMIAGYQALGRANDAERVRSEWVPAIYSYDSFVECARARLLPSIRLFDSTESLSQNERNARYERITEANATERQFILLLALREIIDLISYERAKNAISPSLHPHAHYLSAHYLAKIGKYRNALEIIDTDRNGLTKIASYVSLAARLNGTPFEERLQ